MQKIILTFFTSLRLTVACLVMAMLLVMAGTLAQVHLGLWEAQKQYFQSWMVFWTPEGSSLRIPVWPGGHLLGWLLLINLVAAHLKRFKLTKQKTGIFLTHIGLILLLLGQFLTELLQVESSMRLEEGESKTYSESTRHTELAILDLTGSNVQEVVVVPDSVLARKGEIRDPKLPFSLRIKEWFPNSDPRPVAPVAEPNTPRGTQGIGTRLTFVPRPVTAKMDEANFPSAQLEIVTGDSVDGIWMVSTFLNSPSMISSLVNWTRSNFGIDLAGVLDQPQRFTRNGHTYELTLRPTRHYKFTSGATQPYSLTLLDFRHDRYKGTEKAKNFSSRVRLHNPHTGEDREVLIYMNNPLRYGGETYYQASFDPRNEHATILQVVRNPVWLTPYLACLIVAAGLLIQFLMHLFGFAKTRSVGSAATKSGQDQMIELHDQRSGEGTPVSVSLRGGGAAMSRGNDKSVVRWLPWILAGCFGLWLAGQLLPPRNQGMFHIPELGKLPILLNGRIQPMDSMARNALLTISGKSIVRVNGGQDKMPATEWALEVMTKPEAADQRKIFRLENMDLRAWLNAREGRLGFVSLDDMRPKLEEIERQARQIGKEKKEAQLRTGYERDIMHLFESLLLYHRIKSSLQPGDVEDFSSELAAFTDSIPKGVAALRKKESGQEADPQDLERIAKFFHRYQAMAEFGYVLAVPPPDPRQHRDDWKNVGTALLDSLRSGELPPAINHLVAITSAYRNGDAPRFNQAVSNYRDWLSGMGLIPELNKGAREAYFNQVEFFYKTMIVYIAAALLGCAFWINFSEPLRRAAAYILTLGFVMHTAGLVFRMTLEGRPPVTNLYSSAVFVGWGSVLLGLLLERIYQGAIGVVVAGLVGFVSLIIAHHLSLASDTLQVLEAVLDTNVWLATHVVIVTTGYASMLVAGLLAVIYIVRGLFTKGLTGPMAKSLPRMVYGILCFATLFSFTGTVLGGIWADQSWGRFWGWDPKENGALLIVLWCAVILHARWGGLVKERGLMALAVVGNIITSLSWFGVNMLGVGLHSYGFMDGAFKWLFALIVSQACLIILALLPSRCWLSFREAEQL